MPPEQHRGHDRHYQGPVTVHARKHPGSIALCGIEAGWGKSTTKKSEVTCATCLKEIERRLAKKQGSSDR